MKTIAALILLLSPSLSAPSDYERAIDAFREGRFSDVLTLLDALPAAEAQRGPSQNLKALALSQLGRYDEAMAASRKACEADPDNANYVYNAGLILTAKRDFSAAKALYLGALVRLPKASKLYVGLAEAQFQLYELREAEKSLRKAVEIEPDSASAQEGLAKLFYATGDREQFGQAASRAMELNPEGYLANYYYGLWLSEYESDKASAAKYFEKCVQLYPGFAEGLAALAKILAARQQWPQAVELYERALKLDPRNRQLYYQVSIAYRKAGKTEKAEWAMKQFQGLAAISEGSSKSPE